MILWEISKIVLLSSTSPKDSNLKHSDNQSTSVTYKTLHILVSYYLYNHTSFHSLNICHINLLAVSQMSRLFLITLYESETLTLFSGTLSHSSCFIFSSLYLTQSDELYFKFFCLDSYNKI